MTTQEVQLTTFFHFEAAICETGLTCPCFDSVGDFAKANGLILSLRLYSLKSIGFLNTLVGIPKAYTFKMLCGDTFY